LLVGGVGAASHDHSGARLRPVVAALQLGSAGVVWDRCGTLAYALSLIAALAPARSTPLPPPDDADDLAKDRSRHEADPPVEGDFELLEEAAVDGDVMGRPGTARSALGRRDFRVVWLGTFGSNVGTWMQNVALGAFAYKLTKSAEFVAVIGFVQLGPVLALGLIGGALADAVDRRALLIITNIEQLIFSVVLAFVAAVPHPSRSSIVLTVLAIGVGNALTAAPLSALLPSLVPRSDLPGAVSLQSVQLNLSRVVGPALGGVLLPAIGVAGVFALNAATYLIAVATLMAVPSPPRPASPGAYATGLGRLTAGLSLARRDRYVGRILLTIASFSLLCLPFLGLLPVLAERNLHVDSQSLAYGLMYAAFGTGAAAGAISVGTVLVRFDRPKLIRLGLAGFAVSLAVFAALRSPAPAYPVAFLLGAAYFTTVTSLSTALQAHLADEVRGRVMALYTMGFGGTVPIGLLLFGAVAQRTSVTTIMVVGVVAALVMAVLADLDRVR
jgi:MFS family permease